jgi:two-component system, NarL family, response regulator DesR
MLRIALLDDHPAIVAGLQRLIAQENDLEVIASASDPVALARRLHGRRADVVVLDHDVARSDGLATCTGIKGRPDPPAVVIYSAHTGPSLVIAARAAQADAVVDKSAPVHVLLGAIRTAASGGTQFPAVTRDAYEISVARLEDSDLPVFAMLLDGDRPGAIAEALRIDEVEARRRTKRVVGRLRRRPRKPSGRPIPVPEHPR